MEMDIRKLLEYTVNLKASDLHISVGIPPVIRLNGRLIRINEYPPLQPSHTEIFVEQLLNEK